MIALEPHLPVLQVAVPMLLAPLVVLLHPRGLAWAAATGLYQMPPGSSPPAVMAPPRPRGRPRTGRS